MPQVNGSRDEAAGVRPYFSFSMNSPIGISLGMGGSWPADLAGRKAIFPSRLLVVIVEGCMTGMGGVEGEMPGRDLGKSASGLSCVSAEKCGERLSAIRLPLPRREISLLYG